MRAIAIDESLKGKRVVLRASLNVPVKEGVITNTYRLTETAGTIDALAAVGARVCVLAHIGRNPNASLHNVGEELQKQTTADVRFVPDVLGVEAAEAVLSLKDGEVILLENVRSVSGEKENDDTVAETLASYGELYINDAFADAHRNHASIVGVPRHIPGYFGPNFIKEYEGILPARDPQKPSVAIVGGLKFETKEPLITYLLETYDTVFIGGALANDFFKAQGYEVGASTVSGGAHVMKLLDHPALILATDVVVERNRETVTVAVDAVSKGDNIVDIGPESINALNKRIQNAGTVLWNGPMGYFEGGHRSATDALARYVGESSAHTIVGGGDTVTAIEEAGIKDSFTFVSTGGGAMLELIARGTIAGIEAIS